MKCLSLFCKDLISGLSGLRKGGSHGTVYIDKYGHDSGQK